MTSARSRFIAPSHRARADDGRTRSFSSTNSARRAFPPARAWTCGPTRTSISPRLRICSKARSSIATASARTPVIEPGAVNLMTAGSGIVHSERSPRGSARETGRASTACRRGSLCPTGKEELDPALRSRRRGWAAGRGGWRVPAPGCSWALYGAPPRQRRSHSPTIYADIELGAGVRTADRRRSRRTRGDGSWWRSEPRRRIARRRGGRAPQVPISTRRAQAASSMNGSPSAAT